MDTAVIMPAYASQTSSSAGPVFIPRFISSVFPQKLFLLTRKRKTSCSCCAFQYGEGSFCFPAEAPGGSGAYKHGSGLPHRLCELLQFGRSLYQAACGCRRHPYCLYPHLSCGPPRGAGQKPPACLWEPLTSCFPRRCWAARRQYGPKRTSYRFQREA